MDSYILRPALRNENITNRSAQLICFFVAIAFHVTAAWLIYVNRAPVITPPEQLTISARWVGDSTANDAPKPVAQAATPTPPQPPELKKEAPTPPKVIKKVVKKPAEKIKPVVPKPEKAKPTKPTQVVKKQPEPAPTTPVKQTSNTLAAGNQSASTPAKSQPVGAGASGSAPIARDTRLNNPEPPYPSESRRRGEEGSVILNVFVAADGSASEVKVDKSSGHRRLDMVARKTVSRWKFIPAKQNNAAVAAWMKVTIIFKLRA